jgi:hypothetical protein
LILKIQKVFLQGFKSIKQLALPEKEGELENLVILIGRNSSGKTNFIEALDCFFREFDATFERPLGAQNPELWHNRDMKDPIIWDITLKLEQSEISALFGKDLLPIFDGLADKDIIRIQRRIIATPQDMRWKTIELFIDHVSLVHDGLAVPPEEIQKILVRKEAVPANLVQTVLTNLQTLLRAQFKYINAARDNSQTYPPLGNRTSIIEHGTLTNINNLASGVAPEVRKQWTPLRKRIESNLPNQERVDSKLGQLFLENEPFAASGGGSQSILALIYEVETGPHIVAVEEPENHLHPELIKKSLQYFQNITSTKMSKQLFVTTHSPFLVDSFHFPGLVSCHWDGSETRITQIGTKKDLKFALFDIGCRPSDIFFSDLVLIVEGESDKIVFHNWSRILGVPLEEIHAAVVPAKGVNKSSYHLTLWAEISSNLGLPTYVIVDKSGQTEVDKIIKLKLVDENNTHVLQSGDIEDYYPSNTLVSAIKKLFDVDIPEDKIPSTGRAKFISKEINKGPEEWKVLLAEQVSVNTDKKFIPKEIGDFLRRVHNENRI